MKEVSLGAQTDLILFKEVGMLTDGSYAKRRDGTEECKFVMSFLNITSISNYSKTFQIF